MLVHTVCGALRRPRLAAPVGAAAAAACAASPAPGAAARRLFQSSAAAAEEGATASAPAPSAPADGVPDGTFRTTLAQAIGEDAYAALQSLMADKSLLSDVDALTKRMDELTVELFGEGFEEQERAKMDADALKIVDAFDAHLESSLPAIVGTDGTDGVGARDRDNEMALARELNLLDQGESSTERVVNALWNCGLDVGDDGNVVLDDDAADRWGAEGKIPVPADDHASIHRTLDPDAGEDDGMGAGFVRFHERDGGEMAQIIGQYYDRWAKKDPATARRVQHEGQRLTCEDLDHSYLAKSPAMDMFNATMEDPEHAGVEEFEGGKTKGHFFEPKQSLTPGDEYAERGEDVHFSLHSRRGVRKLLELEQWYAKFDRWMHREVQKVEQQNDFDALLLEEPEYIGDARVRYSYAEYLGVRGSELEVHPAQRKVALRVSVPALGLNEAEEECLAALCGPRYCADSRDLTLVSRKHPTMLQNRVHVRLVLGRALHEARTAAASGVARD
jgi:hypothetical protein